MGELHGGGGGGGGVVVPFDHLPADDGQMYRWKKKLMLDFFITGNVICDFSAAFIQTFIVYGWCLRNEKMKMTQIFLQLNLLVFIHLEM